VDGYGELGFFRESETDGENKKSAINPKIQYNEINI